MTNLYFLFSTKNEDVEEYFTRTSFLKYWNERGHKNIFACPKTKKN